MGKTKKTNGAKKTVTADRKVAALIGENIAKARENVGFTQETLAQRLDVTPLYVSALENGRRTPSLHLLIALADALVTSMDRLCGRVKAS